MATPEPIRLDTSDEILTAAAWVVDRQLDRTDGQSLSPDDQDRALALLRKALLRLTPTQPSDEAWVEATPAELPAWLRQRWEDFDARR